MGGTPAQAENAAEIGMEHHLGLTCDPVGGLVQIPCIERNAIAAGEGHQRRTHGTVRRWFAPGQSLDQVIKTMRDTGADMQTKVQGNGPGRPGSEHRGVLTGSPRTRISRYFCSLPLYEHEKFATVFGI
jgi:hypothetical protein